MAAIKMKGFTLIEIALVLLIIGLLVGGSVSLMKTQRESARLSDTSQRVNQAKEALFSYLAVNQYLPCPDTDDNGTENRQANGTCTANNGSLPYTNMGLKEADSVDGFGNDIRYAVNQSVTVLADMQNAAHSASYFCDAVCAGANPLPIFNLDTPPSNTAGLGANNLSICHQDNAACTAADQMEMEGLSVVLLAQNQRGALACAGLSLSEAENCDTDLLYWQSNLSTFAGGTAIYDDKVVGISGYEIKSRLLQARPDVFD